MKLFCLIYNSLQVFFLMWISMAPRDFSLAFLYLVPVFYILSFVVLLLLVKLRTYEVKSFQDIGVFLMSTPVSAVLYYGVFRLLSMQGHL